MKQILLFSVFLLSFCSFARFEETFSGPSPTSNNPWAGDTDKVTINTSGQLQFTSPKGEAGHVTLFVPIEFHDNMTWEMDVKLDFKPTNANNLRVYIYRSESLKIYIQVGNNNGQISLYKQEWERSPVLVIAGRKQLLSEKPYAFVSIKVIREQGNSWTLYTRREGEETYHQEGSADEPIEEPALQNQFMLIFRHIQSRISTYYVDNIKITHEEENEKPEPEKPGPEQPEIEAGEIIFNELLPNPFSGGSEYIELYNRSDRSLSLQGLAIATRKADGTTGTLYPLPHSVLEKEGYALLTKNIDGVVSWYSVPFPDALHEVKLPILANTSSTLVLIRISDKSIIDEISYSSKWHASSVKNQKGVSLERINPEKNTQDANNWSSAAASCGYGTPGYQNSQYENSEEGKEKGIHIDTPVYDEGGFYRINYTVDEAGYSCRAHVYNTNGSRVAEITNNELLGFSGELLWDGKSSGGSRLRTGMYILSVELYHPKGKRKHIKKVFLLH